MTIFAGIDIAKEIHWVCVVDSQSRVLLDRKLLNTPADLDRLVEELKALLEPVRVGVDVLGGIAALAEAVLLQAGLDVVHVPGLAVNRARQATVGGESKSDPRDARVIADQVRTRGDLRQVVADSEADVEIRLLVSRRRDLVEEQTRRLARMHDLLVGIFPELEQALDLTSKTALTLLTGYVSAAQLRGVSHKALASHLGPLARRSFGRELIAKAKACAEGQLIAVPGERLTAEIVKELAREALAAIERIDALERSIEERLTAHPDAALIRSLPGMGVVLTAQFIAEAGRIDRFKSADALAAAAGLAPVLKQSGKSRWLKRANHGDKSLKLVFYQSAFASLRHADSKAFYERKRRQGKRHHQAVIALARRRVNVLWAMLTHRKPFVARAEMA